MHHFSPWNVDDDGEVVELGVLDAEGEAVTGLELALFGLYKAVASTLLAVESNGKAGVVWHTQGSGKSMEMELYANLVIRAPKLLSPTIIVITDRNELDGQLYNGFQIRRLLPEQPKQIRKRAELREELTNRVSGGIYFTTLQKFGRYQDEREAGAEHPLLSSRRNIIVVVDEAHRSHYDDLDGFARQLRDALPHATLIAFTGTPISFDDRNTQEVFGDYIDIYDLTRVGPFGEPADGSHLDASSRLTGAPAPGAGPDCVRSRKRRHLPNVRHPESSSS